MDKCVYPECMYHGLKDRKEFHKCELHKTMCDYMVDGKHVCKLYSVTHFTGHHGDKHGGYYCEEHGKMRCKWTTNYYGYPCKNLAVQYHLCAEHTCIVDGCQEMFYDPEAESYLSNAGYCKIHWVGDRVRNYY